MFYVQKFISNIHIRIEMCLKEDKVRFTFFPTASSRLTTAHVADLATPRGDLLE